MSTFQISWNFGDMTSYDVAMTQKPLFFMKILTCAWCSPVQAKPTITLHLPSFHVISHHLILAIDQLGTLGPLGEIHSQPMVDASRFFFCFFVGNHWVSTLHGFRSILKFLMYININEGLRFNLFLASHLRQGQRSRSFYGHFSVSAKQLSWA